MKHKCKIYCIKVGDVFLAKSNDYPIGVIKASSNISLLSKIYKTLLKEFGHEDTNKTIVEIKWQKDE
ncbi:hypothetical protein [Labilibacter marinus]|uniref:hypothetical protein n=1 Tax=Labilibacter marinus TaxID=1477105 RepID=UPI0008350D52|nr:hypothetical protein [Labilibacter marinus]